MTLGIYLRETRTCVHRRLIKKNPCSSFIDNSQALETPQTSTSGKWLKLLGNLNERTTNTTVWVGFRDIVNKARQQVHSM